MSESIDMRVGAVRPMRKLILSVLLVGAALLIGADAFIGIILYCQWQTHGWSSTEGVIESARVTKDDFVDGRRRRDQYHLEVKYHYKVDDRAYTGDRWRYGGSMKSTSRSDFPSYDPGNVVDVYYDPGDPSQAVLASGLTDLDRAMLLFISQLNLPIVLVLVAVAASRMRLTGAMPVRHVGSRELVRVASFTPFAGALLGATIGALLAIVLGWLFLGTDPKTTTYLMLVPAGAAVIAATVTWLAQRAGAGCVICDADAETLSFTTQIGLAQKKVTVSRDRVQSVGLGEELSPISTTWRLVIRARQDGEDEVREMPTGRWARADDATAIAEWLSRRLQVPRKDNG